MNAGETVQIKIFPKDAAENKITIDDRYKNECDNLKTGLTY
jgi:hypothetical protein